MYCIIDKGNGEVIKEFSTKKEAYAYIDYLSNIDDWDAFDFYFIKKGRETK